MKLLKVAPGTHFEPFEYTCKGFFESGCGAQLLIEPGDVFWFTSAKYDTFVMLQCPCCHAWTALDDEHAERVGKNVPPRDELIKLRTEGR